MHYCLCRLDVGFPLAGRSRGREKKNLSPIRLVSHHAAYSREHRISLVLLVIGERGVKSFQLRFDFLERGEPVFHHAEMSIETLRRTIAIDGESYRVKEAKERTAKRRSRRSKKKPRPTT